MRLPCLLEGAQRAEKATGRTKTVSVCGEAAADPALAVVLVGLGVKALSMNTRSLSAVAAVLIPLGDCIGSLDLNICHGIWPPHDDLLAGIVSPRLQSSWETEARRY